MDKKDEYVQQINQFLPTDIRVHGLTKVSKNFNAKNQCTKRRYNYLLPTYMLNDRKNMQYILQTLFLEQGPVVGAGYGGGYADPSSDKFLTTEYLAKARGSMISYRIDGNKLELLKDTLQCFLGTHYFHNYTVNQKPTDATSQRFIDKFECHEPFVKDGVEWILLSLTGQSFLYNQIRKMVGMIVEVCRGNASKKTIDLTFSNHKVSSRASQLKQ